MPVPEKGLSSCWLSPCFLFGFSYRRKRMRSKKLPLWVFGPQLLEVPRGALAEAQGQGRGLAPGVLRGRGRRAAAALAAAGPAQGAPGAAASAGGAAAAPGWSPAAAGKPGNSPYELTWGVYHGQLVDRTPTSNMCAKGSRIEILNQELILSEKSCRKCDESHPTVQSCDLLTAMAGYHTNHICSEPTCRISQSRAFRACSVRDTTCCLVFFE